MGLCSGPSKTGHSTKSGIPRTEPLEEQELHGLAGEFVRLVEPESDADPAALLLHFLAMVGNVVGSGHHFLGEADRHALNEFGVILGDTSHWRKATSLSQVKRPLRSVDEEWVKQCFVTGLSSGEGLIFAIRDRLEKQELVKAAGRIVDYQSIVTDAGVDDKRLLVVESEFATPLRIAERDGSTLSPTSRQAWDTSPRASYYDRSPELRQGMALPIAFSGCVHAAKNSCRKAGAWIRKTLDRS